MRLAGEQARQNLGVRVDGWKIDQAASRLVGRNGVTVTYNQEALFTHPPTNTFGG